MRSAAFAWALPLMVAATPAMAAAPSLTVASPDGHNRATVAIDDQNRAVYSIMRDGETLIAPSAVGLTLDSGRIEYGLAVTGSERRTETTRYPIVAGKAATGGGRYDELVVHLAETGGAKRRMDLVLRAFDDGIAFHIVLPVQAATAGAAVESEGTEFRFPEAWRCWGFDVGHFGSSHEGEFDPVDTNRIREFNLFDLPFLCRAQHSAFLLTEAGLNDFAGMYLSGLADGGRGLAVTLSPSLADPAVAVHTRIGSPIETPWRVVMLADKAGELASSTLLTTLSAPSKIADPSWIAPGKSAWDWWNGPSIASVEDVGTNTATERAYIDFAAANGLSYALIDDGWYVGSGKAPLVLPGTDVTRPTDAIDIPGLVAYAKAKGVRLWLWVDWKALDAQMEDALATYQRWGIAGIKVDFMNRDDQAMVGWYDKVLSSAARHHLMVDLHGAFPPRGLTRTWPNFMTQEGVLGAEYNKWSKRVTAHHNVMLAYTRAMLGPMDYTPGGFENVAPADFVARNVLPEVQTTRAHGLSMYVVFPSPLAMVSDSPDVYAKRPAGLDFVRSVPTSWDETRFLGGTVGDWIAIARRKGTRWYVGVMNGDDARTVTIPLGDLGNQGFAATVWRDGDTPTAVMKNERTIAPGDGIRLDLHATGGAAMILDPR